jgi:hypothetical protein
MLRDQLHRKVEGEEVGEFSKDKIKRFIRETIETKENLNPYKKMESVIYPDHSELSNRQPTPVFYDSLSLPPKPTIVVPR